MHDKQRGKITRTQNAEEQVCVFIKISMSLSKIRKATSLFPTVAICAIKIMKMKQMTILEREGIDNKMNAGKLAESRRRMRFN